MPATVWKGYISFGLVSFPVRLFSAARSETVHFHMLHKKDLSRVKEVWYCAAEDKPLDRSEIVKGFETSKNRYVVVDDEELKKIAPATATTIEVLQFVNGGEVDPIYLEKSYYMAPDEKVSKPYVLFMQALKETGYAAVAKISMHSREHIVLIRPGMQGLLLHTLFYSNELHSANRQTSAAKTSPTRKELDLAKNLIRQLAGPFKPDQFEDTYRKNVEKLIEQKKKGVPITGVTRKRKAPVIDLMDALQRSLNMASPNGGKRRRTSKAARGRKVA
ncbi:MAG TPA: Ku protein [Bryobacteraceae bacterium]